jgi:hypothetical protein
LDSDEAKTLSADNYSSSSFWKGTLQPYRELIDIDDNLIASPGFILLVKSSGYFFKFCLEARSWLDINVNSVPGPLSICRIDSSDCLNPFAVDFRERLGGSSFIASLMSST